MIDTQLASFATVRQLEYLEAVDKHGSNCKAAKALGVGRRAIDRSLKTLREYAALKGYSPEHQLTRPIAPGLKMRGTSQLFRKGEVEPVLEWIKTSTDEQARAQAIRDAYSAMADDLPRLSAVPAPNDMNAALCNLYTLTDSHVGMLAWGKESGADWDLKIAEETLTGCFRQMVDSSPRAAVGIVNQLGDFLHYDGMVAATPTSGHPLDADGRFSKMVTTAVRILRRVVDMALSKHKKVIVLMAEGNHDIASSVWLRVLFRALYENEPRVQVIDSELPYYVHRHGKTMLAFHHGHLRKNDQLPILFASQFPQIWGETTKRYAHCGHRHHSEEKEHSGITVIQHPTLAARDAYAARGGWVAERAVTAISYHSEYGQVGRVTITPEMLG